MLSGFKVSLSIAVLTLLVPLYLSASRPAEGIFDEVQDDVRVLSLEGDSRPAESGAYIYANEEVRTGKEGFARIVFVDGSAMVVRSSSRVEISDHRTNPNGSNSVSLYLGRMWASITGRDEDDEDEAFQVITPTAVAGVRGTSFEAGVGKDGAARVVVEKGMVKVSSPQGTVEVGENQETTVEFNRGPADISSSSPEEARWKEWVTEHREKLIKHGKSIVPLIMRDVRKARLDMYRLKNKGERMFKRFKRQADRARKHGREFELKKSQKVMLAGHIKDTLQALQELHRTDRQMMARYYLLKQIEEDVKANPDDYDPEFREMLNDVVDKLEELDVMEIHRRNRKAISSYLDFIEKFARKHKLGKYKHGVAEDRKELLYKARKEYSETQQGE